MNRPSADPRRQALEHTITRERLGYYLDRCGGDWDRALALYTRNIRLGEALYTPLQGLEVTLRNALNGALCQKVGANWYDPHFALLHHPQTSKVKQAINALTRDGKPAENGRVIAELHLGFWVGLLGGKYETVMWRKYTRHVFPHRPRGYERHEVHGALNRVRRLRNRVAHHEKILHRDLPTDYDLVLAIVSWICPQTSLWIGETSRFEEELRRWAERDPSARTSS